MRLRPRVKDLLALVWFAACLAVLAFASARFDFSGLDRTFFPMMFCLTLPVGIVAAIMGLVVYLPFYCFVPLAPGGAHFYLLMWIFMVGVGFWQWLVTSPRVFRRQYD
jgi:hypothetical protein